MSSEGRCWIGVARPRVGGVGPSSQRQNAIRYPGKSVTNLEICKLSNGHDDSQLDMQHSAHESLSKLESCK